MKKKASSRKSAALEPELLPNRELMSLITPGTGSGIPGLGGLVGAGGDPTAAGQGGTPALGGTAVDAAHHAQAAQDASGPQSETQPVQTAESKT